MISAGGGGAKLEAMVCFQSESQSFPYWILSAIFEY